jgi:hypothetical protein
MNAGRLIILRVASLLEGRDAQNELWAYFEASQMVSGHGDDQKRKKWHI